jgi:drug/metabolite transporter (DMT)-like permease
MLPDGRARMRGHHAEAGGRPHSTRDPNAPVSRLRTLIFISFTLIAFAANSVLGRAALGQAAIDPITFTAVRLVSGALALTSLASIAGFTTGARTRAGGSWISAAWLLIYAFPFSLAYASLTTATGALVLFGAVQVTMLGAALWSGERPSALQYTGFGLAIGGFLYLLAPGLNAPPVVGAAAMSFAGVAWAVYSLRGQSTTDPLGQTTGNFVRAAPVALVLSLVALPVAHVEWRGVALAAVSGALTSGIGYVLWYSALRGLTATAAGVVQLLVPVLAALGGVIVLGESVSSRLVLSAVLVLGGIALVIATRPVKA